MADRDESRLEDEDTSQDRPVEVPSDKSKSKSERSSFLTTKNAAEIREEPNGQKLRFHLQRDTIRECASGEFLILGFDTEYQANQQWFAQEEVKAGRAKYEVLSYQFYAINSTGMEWSGIAVPDKNKRLSLGEFLVYALAKGQLIGEKIPNRIILVGHYNRADVPAFEERNQLFWQLNNIRNSLISLGRPVIVKVQLETEDATSAGIGEELSNTSEDEMPNADMGEEYEYDDGDDSIEDDIAEDEDDEIADKKPASASDATPENSIELRVYIRDTILLAPAGRKSLAEIGKLLKIEKMKLADTPEDELDIKRNMRILRSDCWELFRPYAIRDAEVSAKYFRYLTNLYREVSDSKYVPVALSNIGVKLLTREWADRPNGATPDEYVGRETIKETVFNEFRGQFTTKKRRPYIEEISWFIDFVTECYHGGRNEQLWFGPSFEDNWSDYDLSSAYPTAMALIGKPDWKAIRTVTNLNKLKAGTLGFACVDFEFPPNTRYPTLPVRTGNGIVFPLSGRSYCGAPEIELARQLGCKMTLRFAVMVPQNNNDLVFFPFIKDSIEKRLKAEQPLEKEFWKEVTNSCYGKTAQGLRDKRVFNMREKKSDRIPPSPISNPFYAAYITSFVRAVVGEFMTAVPEDKMVFSVTTDGFITNATDKEMAVAKQKPLATMYSKVRERLTGNPEVLAEKHHARQLLGWRTRGQATIKSGEEKNGDSKPIVLAKAGIKPPIEATETDEQNTLY